MSDSKIVYHWCIADDCKHGTLNGSLALGSLFLAEYQKGYEAGYLDARKYDPMIPTMVEHGYTCGICDWGRKDQPRTKDDYDVHMETSHRKKHMRHSINGCVTCERKWYEHTAEEQQLG